MVPHKTIYQVMVQSVSKSHRTRVTLVDTLRLERTEKEPTWETNREFEQSNRVIVHGHTSVPVNVTSTRLGHTLPPPSDLQPRLEIQGQMTNERIGLYTGIVTALAAVATSCYCLANVASNVKLARIRKKVLLFLGSRDESLIVS